MVNVIATDKNKIHITDLVDIDELRSHTGSLPNSKVLEIGSVPVAGNGMILHGASNSTEDLRNAFLMISQVPGVKEVLPLTSPFQHWRVVVCY